MIPKFFLPTVFHRLHQNHLNMQNIFFQIFEIFDYFPITNIKNDVKKRSANKKRKKITKNLVVLDTFL